MKEKERLLLNEFCPKTESTRIMQPETESTRIMMKDGVNLERGEPVLERQGCVRIGCLDVEQLANAPLEEGALAGDEVEEECNEWLVACRSTRDTHIVRPTRASRLALLLGALLLSLLSHFTFIADLDIFHIYCRS